MMFLASWLDEPLKRISACSKAEALGYHQHGYNEGILCMPRRGQHNWLEEAKNDLHRLDAT